MQSEWDRLSDASRRWLLELAAAGKAEEDVDGAQAGEEESDECTTESEGPTVDSGEASRDTEA